MKLTIIGAGAMGSALTVPMTEKGHELHLYGTEFDQEILAALENGKPHPSLDTKLPGTVRYFWPDSIEEALDGAELILIAVTSEGILPVMNALLPYLNASVPLLTVAKGLLDLDGNTFCIGSGMGEYVKSINGLSLKRLPILSAIHKVLYEGDPVEDCIDRLELSEIAHPKDSTR